MLCLSFQTTFGSHVCLHEVLSTKKSLQFEAFLRLTNFLLLEMATLYFAIWLFPKVGEIKIEIIFICHILRISYEMKTCRVGKLGTICRRPPLSIMTIESLASERVAYIQLVIVRDPL